MSKKLALVAVIAAAAALPTGAGAAGFAGVVVAKEPARNTIAVASKTGIVRTVRIGRSAEARVRVGLRVGVRARGLADGTHRATSVRVGGRAEKSRVRGVLVADQRALNRYVLTAGGTVFTIGKSRGRTLAASTDNGPKPGDRLVIVLVVGPEGKLVVESLSTVGRADALELEGIFLGVSDGTLQIAVAHRGLVTVAVPAGVVVPALSPGAPVELVVTVGADRSFTLVAIQRDGGDHDHGIDLEEDSEIEVEGVISELTESSITVRAGRGASSVTCALPSGFASPRFEVGDRVEIECKLSGGSLVLRELEHEEDDEEEDEDADEDEDDD